MKKILFCYFHPEEYEAYIHLDIGYILAGLKKIKAPYCANTVRLSFQKKWEKEDLFASFDLSLLEYYDPEAVFFFLDNVLWSGNIALRRFKIISSILRKKHPFVFVGFQSCKLTAEEQEEVFVSGLADCIVKDNPIDAFSHLDMILEKKPVSNVLYKGSDNFGRKNFRELFVQQEQVDLDYFPSPYTEGIFDNFLIQNQMKFNGRFETFLYSSWGCPYGCFYCFRSVKFEKVRFFSVKRFYDEIEYLLNNFGIISFFVIDDVFVAGENRLKDMISEFENRKKTNKSLEKIGLRVMMRPEFLTRDAIVLLKKIHVSWIQIGLQTVNPSLQQYMTRSLPVDRFREISKDMHDVGIQIHLDIIMGLPGDTIDFFKKTVDFALALDPFSIQVKQLYLIPKTLFYNQRVDYQIEVKDGIVGFLFPFVARAIGGVDAHYINDAAAYVEEKIQRKPEIRWKLLWMGGLTQKANNK